MIQPQCQSRQDQLELLWTVYSEEKLQSFLELTNFQNHFNKDKSVKYFSSLAAVKIGKKRVPTLFLPIFTATTDEKYFSKKAKAGPGYDEIP